MQHDAGVPLPRIHAGNVMELKLLDQFDNYTRRGRLKCFKKPIKNCPITSKSKVYTMAPRKLLNGLDDGRIMAIIT